MTDGIGEVDVPNVYIFFRQACLGQSIFSGLPHTLRCLIDVSQYGTRGKKGRTFSQLVNRRVDDFWSELRGRDHQGRSAIGQDIAFPFVERIGHERRRQDAVDGRDFFLIEHRVRVQRGPLAHGNHHGSHFLGRGAGLVHVSSRHHGDDAVVRGSEGIFPLKVYSGLCKEVDEFFRRNGGMHRHVGNENGSGSAAFDQLLGEAQTIRGRSAARIADTHVFAAFQAQLFRNLAESNFSGEPGLGLRGHGYHGLDVVLVEAGTCDRRDTGFVEDVPPGSLGKDSGRDFPKTDDCQVSFTHGHSFAFSRLNRSMLPFDVDNSLAAAGLAFNRRPPVSPSQEPVDPGVERGIGQARALEDNSLRPRR